MSIDGGKPNLLVMELCILGGAMDTGTPFTPEYGELCRMGRIDDSRPPMLLNTDVQAWCQA